jgi:hypothetical protein
MITVSCTGCQHEYRVADDKAGKRFKCRDCGDICTVPAAKRRKPGSSATPKRRKPKKQAPRDEWEDDTASSSDDYESYDDYGTDDGGYDTDDGGYDDYEPARSRRKSPSRSGKATKKKRKASKSDDGGRFSFTSPLVWLGYPVAALLLTVAALFIVPVVGAILAVILVIVGLLLGLVGGILSIVGAFKEDVVCGLLYLFVPFYSLYYLVTRWEQQKNAFLMNVCGSILVLGSVAFALPAVQQARNKAREAAGEGAAIPVPPAEFTLALHVNETVIDGSWTSYC